MKIQKYISVLLTCLFATSLSVSAQPVVTFVKNIEVQTGAWLQVEGEVCTVFYADQYKVVKGVAQREVYQKQKPCSVLVDAGIVFQNGSELQLSKKLSSVRTAQEFQEAIASVFK